MMEVFKGWYRQSQTKKGMVWHRVFSVDCVLVENRMAYTVCGRLFSATKCDFDLKPDHLCMKCEKSPGVIVETGRGFAPISVTSITTKTAAIAELKRLLKPRTYCVKIFDLCGVTIIAQWESGISLNICAKTKIVTKKRVNKMMTMEQVQADLTNFKSDIDCLCDATTVLAKKDKKKKKLKGRLTNSEDQEYFDKLIHETEKR